MTRTQSQEPLKAKEEGREIPSMRFNTPLLAWKMEDGGLKLRDAGSRQKLKPPPADNQ